MKDLLLLFCLFAVSSIHGQDTTSAYPAFSIFDLSGKFGMFEQPITFPVDTQSYSQEELMDYFKDSDSIRKSSQLYQQSIDYLSLNDTILWVTKEGGGNFHQKNLRRFIRVSGSEDYRLDTIIVLGSALIRQMGAYPFSSPGHFVEESNCPRDCFKSHAYTDIDLKILNNRQIAVTRYRAVLVGKRQNGVQYSKLVPERTVREIESIDRIIIPVSWQSGPPIYYCQCEE